MVVVEQGAEGFGAYVPDLPGCAAAGESKEEVLAPILGAVDLHILPARRRRGEYVEVGAA